MLHMMSRMVVATAITAAVAVTVAVPVGAAPSLGDRTSGYIVVLRDTGGDTRAVAVGQAARWGAVPSHVYQHAFQGYAAQLTPTAVAALRKNTSVVGIHPDGEVHLAAQALPTGVNRVDGELSSTFSGNGTGAVNADIAIIDTGSGPHSDLNVVGGTNCVTPGGSFNDDNGHGTHVAGIAAARDNAIGVVGVSPGARLWSVKVLNAAGVGTISQLICGIDWVTEQASILDVANLSLSAVGVNDFCPDSALHQALCNSVDAGVTYVAAAGNEHIDANTRVPATYSQVITVSAMADFDGLPGGAASPTCGSGSEIDDTFAGFSNYGQDIDLTAPGQCIYSTYRNNSYATMSGTSMASPHVAGAAALYKAHVNPSATPAEVRTAVRHAGTLQWNWTLAEDPDGTKERILNVDTF